MTDEAPERAFRAVDSPEARRARSAMVDTQLRRRGIRARDVLEVMRALPRHVFAGDVPVDVAYGDHALPSQAGQTLSQPYIVARMTEALLPLEGETVLEIGTGTGYQTAVLRLLGATVYTIERIPELARAAHRRLRALGLADRVLAIVADGTRGWPGGRTFARVVATAAPVRLPEGVWRAVADGGRCVIPIGPPSDQMLVRLDRTPGGGVREQRLCRCTFVPLVGGAG